MIAILLISFFVCLVLGFPIAIALGLSCLLGLALQPMTPLVVIAQRMFVSLDSFPLMAVPLYMLAGYLMSTGGISRRIISFSSTLVGNITGGLAHVNILASMIFAGISGSAVADTAGIGSIMIPTMVERKYSRAYTAAVTGISSTIGIIIPPSIPMVIIGAMLGISVGKLFLGGIIPGVLIGLALMAVAYLMARRNRVPTNSEPFSLKAVFTSFMKAFWALLMPAIVVVGIVGGIVTPTEAGAVAVLYALIIAMFVYRELTLKDVYEGLWKTALSTAKVFFLIATAGLYSWLLTANGFPALVGRFLISITESPTLMLMLIVLILLIITTFMESIAALILLLPILFPVAQQVGIDPIHFGVMVVVSIGIGLVTPPVGLCLFVASDIAETGIAEASRAVFPFVAAMIALSCLFIVFQEFITVIPRLLMG
ncbi:TRAP transporter large permease [Candidatus Poribacteria bacterium]